MDTEIESLIVFMAQNHMLFLENGFVNHLKIQKWFLAYGLCKNRQWASFGGDMVCQPLLLHSAVPDCLSVGFVYRRGTFMLFLGDGVCCDCSTCPHPIAVLLQLRGGPPLHDLAWHCIFAWLALPSCPVSPAFYWTCCGSTFFIITCIGTCVSVCFWQLQPSR